jgi:subtilisin family serine protease
MSRFYHILAKKAMLGAMALLLLFPTHVLAKVSSDPGYSDQKVLWEQINAPAAWDVATGSRNVVVAVIDTGFDIENNDLKANTWVNTDEIPDNGSDDDRNGYVDDVHGWNFVENNNQVQAPVTSAGDNVDAINHGSLVAGLIGAVGDNGLYGTGLNWHVSLMPLRAISNSGSGTTGDVIRAIDYAISKNVDVINMSFVGDLNDSSLRDSFKRAYDHGIVVVAAAGNDRVSGKGDLDLYPEYPACFDRFSSQNWIVGVSSINSQNQLSRFADYGGCVDLVAPGEHIYSTVRYSPAFGLNTEFRGAFNGTSFAAPLVAGAAALIKAVRPEFTAPQIVNILLNSADSVDAVNPEFSGQLGRGQLNVARALQLAQSAPALSTSTPGGPVTEAPVIINTAPDQPQSVIPIEAVAPPAQKFFYTTGKQLFSLDLESNKKIYLTTVPDGTVIDASAKFDPTSGRATIVFLAKQGKVYTAYRYDDQGNLLEKSVIDTTRLKKNKNLIIDGVRLVYVASGAYQLAVKATDARRTKSEIWIQPFGESVAQTFAFAAPVAFDTGSLSNTLFAVEVKAKKATVTEVNLESNVRQTWSLSDVEEVSDVRAGTFFNAETDQLALIVRQPGVYQRLLLDVASKSFWRDTLGTLKRGEKWKISVLGSLLHTTQRLVFGKMSGGIFDVVEKQGKVVGSAVLPKATFSL